MAVSSSNAFFASLRRPVAAISALIGFAVGRKLYALRAHSGRRESSPKIASACSRSSGSPGLKWTARASAIRAATGRFSIVSLRAIIS